MNREPELGVRFQKGRSGERHGTRERSTVVSHQDDACKELNRSFANPRRVREVYQSLKIEGLHW
jgi:hypothetical protein